MKDAAILSLWVRALIVFVAVGIGDVCWARYTAAAATGTRHSAARWAVALYAFGSISVMNYTASHWLIVPALLGAYAGTFAGVKPK